MFRKTRRKELESGVGERCSFLLLPLFLEALLLNLTVACRFLGLKRRQESVPNSVRASRMVAAFRE